jgi:hypothetical protein
LFQEFQQADNAITRKKGGTGFGLGERIIEMNAKVEPWPGYDSTQILPPCTKARS